MTEPVRERILAYYETALTAMTVAGGYFAAPIRVERVDQPVVESLVYPSIDITVASDLKSGVDLVGLNDVIFSLLRVRVRYHTRDTSEAALSRAMSDVIRAILSDPSCGQNAHYTDFSGETEINAEQKWIDVIFETRYSFVRTDPTTRG